MFVGTWAPPCQDRCPYIHSSAEPKSARAARPQRKERVPGFQIYIYEYQRNYFYYGYYRCNGMIGTILESMECLYMKTNGINFEINDAHTCF